MGKKSVLSRHPLAREWVKGDETDESWMAGFGDCLKHPNFVHHDVSGRGIEELQSCSASIAAARAYVPDGTGVGRRRKATSSNVDSVGALAGVAIRTNAGALFSGSVICARRGAGGVSPLSTALVSMCANGIDIADIHSAAWAASSLDSAKAVQLRDGDAKLLAS